MKKAIAILGISLFSMTIFTNSNVLTGNNDLDLASLITLNKADAECNTPWNMLPDGVCDWSGTRCYFTEPGQEFTCNKAASL